VSAASRKPSSKTQDAAGAIDFEAAVAELEAIVERLEQGNLPLEESLQQFERGVALTRQCQLALQAAERKVEVLLKKPDGDLAVTPLGDDDGA